MTHDELKEHWRTCCQHVKEAIELLGVDVSAGTGYVPDTWTLREQCKLAKDTIDRQAKEIERLTAVINDIDLTLRVPAAEYVPAIGDVFTLIDKAGLRKAHP